MKLDIMTMDAKAGSKLDLPRQFSEEIREDLIKRAVEASQANSRQPYGAAEQAGRRHATKLSHRRRDYKTTYGHGISRTPRKILSRRGTRFFWVGAFAPNTVGGRRAHPPKPIKAWTKKINAKERCKAIRSAMSATMQKSLVAARGHSIPDTYPFIIDSSVESISRTKDLRAVLKTLGLHDELVRIAATRTRAGRGKMRGRRKRTVRGPLLVVSRACSLRDAARNIPGIDVCVVDMLNADLLAPGADAGRLTLFTAGAIERLAREGLFLPGYKGPSSAREEKGPKAVQKERRQAEKAGQGTAAREPEAQTPARGARKASAGQQERP